MRFMYQWGGDCITQQLLPTRRAVQVLLDLVSEAIDVDGMSDFILRLCQGATERPGHVDRALQLICPGLGKS